VLWVALGAFIFGAVLGWAVRGAGARLELEAARLRWEREEQEER